MRRGSREEPLAQISTTDWLSQWKSSFLPPPQWTPQMTCKGYRVKLLPLDGAVRQVGGPGTIEPTPFEIDAKTKTPRSISIERVVRGPGPEWIGDDSTAIPEW